MSHQPGLRDRRIQLSAVESGQVVLLGVPSDHNSSFLRGCASAPAAIRAALHSTATNLCAEDGTDLDSSTRLVDAGDLELSESAAFVGEIEQAIADAAGAGAAILALGGDHAVTYPLVRGHGNRYPKLNILHFDAHSDLYDELDGNRLSHACPFARILEEGRVDRLVQIGIRTLNPHQRSQVERFGVEIVEIIEMRDWHAVPSLDLEGPTYLSLDLDVLDPAFAPGISHYEPGGASVRQVIDAIQSLRVPVIGADLVELNPDRDPSGVSAAVAAKLLKELAARMLTAGG